MIRALRSFGYRVELAAPSRRLFPRSAGIFDPESAASSRVAYRTGVGSAGIPRRRPFVRCSARAQGVITKRTPARPESIRVGDAPSRSINPFRRSHIFAVDAA
jgi:hypothetical protein